MNLQHIWHWTCHTLIIRGFNMIDFVIFNFGKISILRSQSQSATIRYLHHQLHMIVVIKMPLQLPIIVTSKSGLQNSRSKDAE